MMRWAFVGREVRRQPGRAILTLLSIILGVGSTVAVSLATQSTRSAYNQLFEKVGGPPTLEITASSGERFPQDIAEKVTAIPEVQAAIPLVFRPTILRFKGKRINTVVVGINLKSLPDKAKLDFEAGGISDEPETGIVEAALAHSIQANVNDRAVMLNRRGVAPITFSGIATTQSALSLTDSGQVFLPLSTVQELFALAGQCDVIRVYVSRANALVAVSKSIAAILPPNIEVHQRVSRMVLSEETLMTAEQGMRFVTVLCLAMSVFIIVNTFLMNLTERRTQFATMRMIGATRRQLQAALLLEGLVLGIAGTVLGTALGIGGSWFISRAMEQLLSVELINTRPDIGTILSGMFVGLIVTLIACWFPARQVGRISPKEALSRVPDARADRFPTAVLVASGVVWILAAILIALVLGEYIPPQFAVGAGVLMLGAFVLLIPLVLTPLTAWCSRLLRRVWHVESLLAQLQLMRRQTRTILTIGVLVVAITNAMGMGSTVIDNVNDVRQWYRNSLIGDFFLSHMAPQSSSSVETANAESPADQLAKVPDIAELESIRFLNARVATFPILLVARSFPVGGPMPLRLIDADTKKVQEQLQAGKLVVASVLARKAGLHIGDTVPVEVLGRTHSLEVAAIANDYNSGGMVAFLERKQAASLFGVEGEDVLAVTAAPGKAAEVKPTLQKFAQANNLLLYSHAELRASIEQLMLGVVGAFWTLLAIGFFVAAFGIANTLTMSVHEQKREIGLLRIIGMTRHQVRRTILLQSVIMAAIALMAGLLGGLTTAWIINLCMRPILGHTVVFQTHWGLFGLLLIVSFALAIISSWIPMRHATKVNLLQVMAQE